MDDVFFIYNSMSYCNYMLTRKMKRTYQTKEMQLKYQLNYIARAGGTSAANVTVSVLQDAKRRFFDHRSVIFNPLTCALLPGVVSHRGRLHEGRMMTLELKNRCCFCVPQRSTECISWGGVPKPSTSGEIIC